MGLSKLRFRKRQKKIKDGYNFVRPLKKTNFGLIRNTLYHLQNNFYQAGIMRSYNTLRGRLFAIDRELEKREIESDTTTFSEAFRKRRKTKTKEQQQLERKVAAEAVKKAQEKQKAAEASKAKPKVNEALAAAGKAVKQVVDTTLGITAPTTSQDTLKSAYTIPILTTDTILEQLEAQTKMMENMVQKMRPAVRLLEEWEEDEKIDLIKVQVKCHHRRCTSF